jgi:hypothetical protein
LRYWTDEICGRPDSDMDIVPFATPRLAEVIVGFGLFVRSEHSVAAIANSQAPGSKRSRCLIFQRWDDRHRNRDKAAGCLIADAAGDTGDRHRQRRSPLADAAYQFTQIAKLGLPHSRQQGGCQQVRVDAPRVDVQIVLGVVDSLTNAVPERRRRNS